MTTLQLGDPLPNYWWFERQWISRTCPQVDKCCQSIHCKPYCFWHVQWLYWFSTQHHPLLLCNSCCNSALLLLFSLIIDTKHQLISSITTSTDLKYQLDLFSIWNLEKRSVDSFLSACKSPPLWRLVWVLGRFLARWFGQIGLGPSDTSVHRWHLPQHLIPSPYQLNLTGSSVFAAPPPSPQIFENLTAPAFLPSCTTATHCRGELKFHLAPFYWQRFPIWSKNWYQRFHQTHQALEHIWSRMDLLTTVTSLA